MLAWGLRFLIAIELLLYGVLAHRVLGLSFAAAFALACAGVLFMRLIPCAATFALSAGRRPRLAWRARLRLWLGEYAAFVANFVFITPAECLWMGPDRLKPGGVGVPVVLVHGYSCSRAAWWCLRRRLLAAGLSVATLSLEPIYADLDRYLPLLTQRIDAVLAQTGARQVVLVGHSMGGLVARAWLAQHGGARVRQLITLGTPHGGTRLAHFGLGRNARQMEPGSAWLKALGSPPVEVLTVYSVHDNYVAPFERLRLPGARRVELVGLGHIAMLYSSQVAEVLIRALIDSPVARRTPTAVPSVSAVSSVSTVGALRPD